MTASRCSPYTLRATIRNSAILAHLPTTPAEPVHAPGVGALVLDCFDPAAMAGALQRGSLEHTQLARGSFRGRIGRSGDGRTRLDWGRYNLPLLVSGCVAPDCLSVGYLHSARGEGSLNGRSIRAGDVAVLGEREDLYLGLPPETEWVALQLPRTWVGACFTGEDDVPTGVFRPTAEGRASLARAVREMRELVGPGTQAGVGVAPEVISAAHENLLGAFLAALGTAGRPRERDLAGTRANRVRIVRRAQDYAAARLGEAIRIPELCAAAGASLASLERAFADLHGMSPKRFLTLHRLSRARRALIHGSVDASTVTDAATACGFFHLGRFAEQYKAFFNEPPSATLRLARAA